MNMSTVGSKIKELREAKNLTQEMLAAKVGCSSKHISVIERGKKIPKLDLFVDIVNALEVSSDKALTDVVDYAIINEASEISLLLQKESPSDKKRILKAFRILLEKED